MAIPTNEDRARIIAEFDEIVKAGLSLTDFPHVTPDYLGDVIHQAVELSRDLARRGITSVETARAAPGTSGIEDWFGARMAAQAALLARSLLRVLDLANSMDERVMKCQGEAEINADDAFLIGVEAGVLFGAAADVRTAVCSQEHPNEEVICRHIASPWSD